LIRIRAFIQARMSSRRFPGKVLAPLHGRPVVWHVIQAMKAGGFADEEITLLTSSEPSDDPVASYAETLHIGVFRGSLHDVLGRFTEAAKVYPCEWILRATADSPCYDPMLIRFVRQATESTPAGFLTTTHRRTLPVGMNVEAFRPELLRAAHGKSDLSAEDREHVSLSLHRGGDTVTTGSIELVGNDFSGATVSIDHPSDLASLESGAHASMLSSILWTNLVSRTVEK